MFKKILIGLVLTLNLWLITPSHAFLGAIAELTGAVSSTVGGVASTVSGVAGSVSSVRNSIDNIVCDVQSIFGGSCNNGLSSIRNAGASVQSSGVVVVQDFDAIYEAVSGNTGVTPTGEFVLPDPDSFNTIGENTSLRQYILNVLNFTLTFLGLIAVAFVIYAGFLYVISNGDDGNTEKAKKIILYAVVGILIILGSFAIINTVIQNAGRGTDDRGQISNTFATPSGTTPINNTNIPINTPGGTTTAPSLVASSLANLVTVSGSGVQDFGNTAVVTPAGARAGVVFGLNTQGVGLFDFGDGTQALLDTTSNPQATVTHPFGDERTYSVRVVLDTAQGQIPVRKDIVVGGLKAGFNLSRAQVSVGESLTLDASTTRVSVGSVREYRWSCSGGSGCFTDTFGRQAQVNFSAAGNYEVTLTVENVLGTTDTQQKTVQVVGGAPVADFSVQSALNVNKPGEFIFNAGGSLNRAGSTQGLTYFWNFDGDFKQTGGPSINYEFSTIGSKTVELVVVENVSGIVLRSAPVERTVQVDTVVPVDFTIN